MTDQPEDTCRPIEVDGESIRVRGSGEFSAQDQAFAAEIVRAAKRKFEAEPVVVQLRAEIAEALRGVPGRWNIRAQVDAVMTVVEPHANLDVLERAVQRARRAEQQCERLQKAVEAVRSFNRLTADASCRMQAIDQATDTLEILDKALDQPKETP